ncbi:MAG TPA: YihY/virulence factor BrkB family protein [Candidatus Elarobacter sp.]|nr:YihY/virulence factor BrkB family protein [Candidatus Elarobacter sp.]
MNVRVLGRLLRETYAQWNRDDGWLYAAAMAAFAALALAPLLVIALHAAESFGDERAVLHGLALVIDPIVGHGGVRALNVVVAHTSGAHGGFIATIVSIVIALFAGSRLFYAVQRALHNMWRTPQPQHGGLMTTFLSFLAAGALSVLVITAITLIVFGSATFEAAEHAAGVRGVWATIGTHLGIGLLGALIVAPVVAALFKWLPGMHLAWTDVWIGAIVTAVGFGIAQSAIGIYLATENLPWTYGSAASVIVVLLWLYYSAYLFLLGAEFTHVYAREVGSLRKSM